MERSLTAVSRVQAAPDPLIPAHLRYITCMRRTGRFPGGPIVMATLTDMATVEDSGL